MVALASLKPPAAGQPFDSVIGWQWAEQLTNFVSSMTKVDLSILDTDNIFTGTNVFQNAPITGGHILGPLTSYLYELAVNKTSDNASTAGTAGGNAAVYVQHLINNTTALVNNTTIGLRVQIDSEQTSTLGLQNDEVAIYAGIYQGGATSAGFGYHLDAYYAATGTGTQYGFNAEMNRSVATGITVGYHLRVIQSTFSTVGVDYGFLVSPSPSGTLPCTVLFSGGSSTFGPITATVGLDLAFANCSAAIRIQAGQPIQWDGVGGFVKTYWDGTANMVLASHGTVAFSVNVFTGVMNTSVPFTGGGGAIVGSFVVNVAGVNRNVACI